MTATVLPRAMRGVAILGASLWLAGCADVGDSFMGDAFVDPAKYDNFDCKQLAAERTVLATRTADTQKLIDKARTVVGGTVVGEMVYRNDYISVRSSARQVEQMWRRNRCDDAAPAAQAVR